MQIHELTQPRLNEGVLDTIKGVAGGALKQFGTGAMPQTGGVAADPDAQPFQGQTIAQARANKAQPNPASIQKFNNIIMQVWSNQISTTEKRLNRTLDDTGYRNLLRSFIDRVFFKDKMELLGIDEKRTIEHAIDTITKFRDNPDQISRTFSELIKDSQQFVPDPKNALKSWVGKVLDVNLDQSGVVRPAKFSWDGEHWVDALSGLRAPTILANKLTNVALGTVR